MVIYTAMEIGIALFLAPAIFAGRLASPMLQMRMQMIMHLASFYVGGVVVGVISPGVRLTEPAIGAFVAVMIVFLMSFFMPHSFMHFDLTKIAVGGGIGFGLGLAGAWSGERIMGNVVEGDDSSRRGRMRTKLWGDHGLLGEGSGSRVPSRSRSRSTSGF
ncbi:MAG: hypothetical protein Q8O67_13785 [Deltaproteobacteria bacterium]|nr:hypothetical protein [Deltaproteobacteria bacterium]